MLLFFCCCFFRIILTINVAHPVFLMHIQSLLSGYAPDIYIWYLYKRINVNIMSWTHTQIKSYESEILHKYMHLREMQKVQRESICCFPVWRGKAFLSSPEEGTGTTSTQPTPDPKPKSTSVTFIFHVSLDWSLKIQSVQQYCNGQNFLYWLSSQRWENSAVNAVPNLMLCLNLRQGIMYSLRISIWIFSLWVQEIVLLIWHLFLFHYTPPTVK